MKLYAKVIAILALPLIFVVAYALCPIQLPPPGWTFSKIDLKGFPAASNKEVIIEDIPEGNPSPLTEEAEECSDSAAQRILFFGDSMAEGLVRRMADYAQENGYQLARVVWYNSTTRQWATSDTLRHYIRRYRPTFFMVCMGGNEQFLKNPAARQPYIQQIISKMGGKPFVWIGIPSWRGDTGFNNLVQQCVGPDRYFDSRHLTLKRCSDRAHPTFEAAGIWMDSIAVWMKDRYPIRMQKPHKKATHKYPLHLLQPES